MTDCKYEYTKALVWRGIADRVRREAIKINDGEAIIRYWRWDVASYFQLGHTKYIALAHRMLTAIHGAVSEKLRHEIMWNRTVNIKGGIANNIPADLHCEHMNKEFKRKYPI